MVKRTYSFGIIGTGMIANFHADAIQSIGNANLATCMDVSKERVDSFSATYGCQGYTALKDMLEHPGLDIVTKCTPSGMHLEAAIACAKAGKHMIIEKPLEITIERCDRIIEEAEKQHVLVAGIFPSRFHQMSQIVKQAIDSNRLGKITLADAYVKWFRNQEYYDTGGWKGTWKFDGSGALMNQSIHAIDLLQWFMGPVSQVNSFCSTIAHKNIEVEDTAVAILHFSSGSLGVVEGTTAAYPGFLKKLEITGSEGSIVIEEENITVWQFSKELPEDEAIRKKYASVTETGGGAGDPKAIGSHGHQLQFKDMIEALEAGRQPFVDGREARKAVEIIQGIYLSAKQKQTVPLPL